MHKVTDPVRDAGFDKVTVVGAGMVGIACVDAILFQVSYHLTFGRTVGNKHILSS